MTKLRLELFRYNVNFVMGATQKIAAKEFLTAAYFFTLV